MHIAILEDDEALSRLYQLWLSSAGHACTFFRTIAEFRGGLRSDNFDLMLLDWELPDGTGDQALHWIRETLGWHIPVICVTVRDAEPDVVNALRSGADDYLAKPPRASELIARIEALARPERARALPARSVGPYQVDEVNRTVLVGGRTVDLTAKEYELACYLLRNTGRLLSRRRLLEAIWGVTADIDTRTVDTHVSRLRQKLQLDPQHGWDLCSVYGQGYRLQSMKGTRS